MAIHARDEVEAAFRVYWQTGAVGEDWDAWCNLFTEEAVHHEHVLGRREGREEIRRWIKPTMERVPELYTALGWYAIDGDRVVCEAINRRDDPSPGGGAIDFPGVTVSCSQGAGAGRSRRITGCGRAGRPCLAPRPSIAQPCPRHSCSARP